jgi:ribonuclease-3
MNVNSRWLAGGRSVDHEGGRGQPNLRSLERSYFHRRQWIERMSDTFQGASAQELEEKQQRCEQLIGYTFANRELLLSALTHASGAQHRLSSNERLEFLGDAVLGFVVCELLFREFPEYLEGDLTKVKSVVVSRETCARVSARIGLEECLILGKGMSSNAVLPASLMADVFESLVAAIYLDGGIEPARHFVLAQIRNEIELAALTGGSGNFKSNLQQLAQRDFGSPPTYQLLGEKGPDHAKCFKVAAQISGRRFTPAWGRNKKDAEQRAASNALAELRDLDPPNPAD